mgnify:CR=1 FL=1
MFNSMDNFVTTLHFLVITLYVLTISFILYGVYSLIKKLIDKKSSQKPIYLIHTITDFIEDKYNNMDNYNVDSNNNINNNNNIKFYKPASIRTPVFKHTLKEAQNFVENNYCDIFEYTYTYALIEEIKPCAYDCPIKRWWYKWDNNSCSYVQYDLPYMLYDDKCPISLVIG